MLRVSVSKRLDHNQGDACESMHYVAMVTGNEIQSVTENECCLRRTLQSICNLVLFEVVGQTQMVLEL